MKLSSKIWTKVNMFDLQVHTYRLKKYFVPCYFVPLVNGEGLIRDCHFRIVTKRVIIQFINDCHGTILYYTYLLSGLGNIESILQMIKTEIQTETI